MEWQKGNFIVSDDQSRLDLDFVVAGLHTTYWAAKRSAALVQKSIPKSLCFGVYRYDEAGYGAQVGFARVVTDGCTFSWLCDVFIAPEVRGHGIGTWLIDCVVSHPQVKSTNKVLATQDAHGLYEKFGFARREMMQKRG